MLRLALLGLLAITASAMSVDINKASFYEVVMQEWEAWKLIHRK